VTQKKCRRYPPPGFEPEASQLASPLDNDRPPERYFELAAPVERPSFARLEACWLAPIKTLSQPLNP
jgi:hypothetical protein